MDTYRKSVIVTPALNEKANLAELIPAILGFLPEISILVVDDSSKDGTEELIEEFSKKFKNLYFLKRKNDFGYGRASVAGFKWAIDHGFDSIVTMDADFSHDFRAIPSLLERLQDCDLVVGSRYVKGGRINRWKFYRRILSRFANFYVRLILVIRLHDMTSGFNAYKAPALSLINLDAITADGYAFLVELKYALLSKGFKFTESPIVFDERREGQSKMSSKIILESVILPWKLIFSKFSKKY